MDKEVQKVLRQSHRKIETSQTLSSLEQTYLEIFGKNGFFTNLTKQILHIPKWQRPKFGKSLNEAKNQIEDLLSKKRTSLKRKSKELIDITAPGIKTPVGHLHLISQAIEDIVHIFTRLGYSLTSHPEVDWDWYAFESLNMPKDHPARDEWETFFIKAPAQPYLGNQVLTPHTSNGQVREMEKVKNPPIRMINIARCYRRQIDVSHTPMFHQFEGLFIDENVSIAHLKGTLAYFTARFFGKDRKVRLRAHHFRFTEPSFEVDVSCGVCKGRGCRFCKGGWVELGGAGMVHPKVLKAGGLNSQKFTGFAFGWGIERTIAMRTNIGDIRLLFQNDIRFLEQF